jgi:arginyl-tRNA synthetase
MLDQCETMLAEHGALDRCVSFEPRRREDQHADLRVLCADRQWLQSGAGADLIAALRGHPAVASADRHRSAILLRFEDSALASLERRLAAGRRCGMQTEDLLSEQRFTVGFVGPNTNKALHVGHLRNIVLGQALAAAMSSSGASVQRHNLVGDIGRRVCEAMGGYLTHHDGEDPQALGVAGDRFVELCCRDFPREAQQAAANAAASDPNSEETEARGDLADAIMRSWMQDAAAERELWRRMRRWALTGHQQTLARLGVRMDRHDFESDGIARALELIERGLEQGLFTRDSQGAVVYRTGRSEYTTMVLLRSDGAPTEYARLLGVYHLMHSQLPADSVYVEVVGIEWQSVMAVQRELLVTLLGPAAEKRFTWAFHGSITVAGQKMGSSTGEVLWIDDLLDEVAACPGVAALQELAGGAAGREELADMVVRGTFLCAPTLQPLEFARERLIEGRAGAGWTIAEAWCRAQRPHKPPQGTPVARTAVVQSQLYRRALDRAVAKRDTAGAANYLLGLSQACLAAPAPGPAAAPMLRLVLMSLGFPLHGSQASECDQSDMRDGDHQPPAQAGALVGDRRG